MAEKSNVENTAIMGYVLPLEVNDGRFKSDLRAFVEAVSAVKKFADGMLLHVFLDEDIRGHPNPRIFQTVSCASTSINRSSYVKKWFMHFLEKAVNFGLILSLCFVLNVSCLTVQLFLRRGTKLVCQ